MNCELCAKPLSGYDLARAGDGEASGYCAACTSPHGTLMEVLNYLRVPVQREPMTVGGEPVAWPGRKDPDEHHEKICRLFKGWRELVAAFKQLRGADRLDIDDLIEYAREHSPEKSYEGLCIVKRESVHAAVALDLSRRALAAYAGAAARPAATSTADAAPLPLGCLEQG